MGTKVQADTVYFIARNAHGKPTLQHALDVRRNGYSACGTKVYGWSRVYTDAVLRGFLCRRCEKILG